MTIIDSQIHAYEANTLKRPWHSVPNWPDHVTGDEMVAAMDKVGVDGAIFISPFSMPVIACIAQREALIERGRTERHRLVDIGIGAEGITEAKSIAEIPSQLPKQGRIEHARIVGITLDAGLDQGGHRKKLHPRPEDRPRCRPSDNRNYDAEATGRTCVPAAPV